MPFTQDSRLPPDTLFLAFEEDFLWWPADREPTPASVHLTDSSADEPTAAATPEPPISGFKPKSKGRQPDRARGKWWEVKERDRMADATDTRACDVSGVLPRPRHRLRHVLA